MACSDRSKIIDSLQHDASADTLISVNTGFHVRLYDSYPEPLRDPADLTGKLGIIPTDAGKKGDTYIDPDGYDYETQQTVSIVRTRKGFGSWFLSTQSYFQKELGNCRNIRTHLEYLLDLLEPKKDILQPYIEDGVISTDITLEVETRDCTPRLPIDLIKRLSYFCGDVGFSIRFTPEENNSSDQETDERR